MFKRINYEEWQMLFPAVGFIFFVLVFLVVVYWVMRAGYRGIETPVLEAARLDGSWLRRWWSIDRPILKSNVIAAMLAAAIVASVESSPEWRRNRKFAKPGTIATAKGVKNSKMNMR